MNGDGELTVHDNVTFQANSAVKYGGAVSHSLNLLVLYGLIFFPVVDLIRRGGVLLVHASVTFEANSAVKYGGAVSTLLVLYGLIVFPVVDLAVHHDVTFQANSTVRYGGAVSPKFNKCSHPSSVVWCDSICGS